MIYESVSLYCTCGWAVLVDGVPITATGKERRAILARAKCTNPEHVDHPHAVKPSPDYHGGDDTLTIDEVNHVLSRLNANTKTRLEGVHGIHLGLGTGEMVTLEVNQDGYFHLIRTNRPRL